MTMRPDDVDAVNHEFAMREMDERQTKAACQFIEATMEVEFVASRWGNRSGVAEDQAFLSAAFRKVVDAWRERQPSGNLDPRQVVRAYIVNAYQHIQTRPDPEWDTLIYDLGDEMCALKSLCDPDN